MARTPLLSRLQRLSVRMRAAQAAGLPLEVAPDREALRRATLERAVRAGGIPSGGATRGEGLSRRDLMKAAGATGVLLAAGSSARAAPWMAPGGGGGGGGNAPLIAIVGGGLAGLVAARRLKGHGIKSTVYEAATRAGGRVDTDHTTFGSQRVERGGELIDTGHKRYRKLIKALGLKLDDLPEAETPGTEDLGFFDGTPYTEAQIAADYVAVFPLVKADVKAAGYPTLYNAYTPAGLALDQLSITQWIESRVPGGNASRFGQLLGTAYNIEYGAEPEQQSALNLLYLLGFGSTPNKFALFGESDERFRVRGGNSQVPECLADELGNDIKLQHSLLAATTLGNGKVRLTFATPSGNKDVTADRVVMTVPFAVLRANVDLTGLTLSSLKRTAIAQQGMGTNSKLHVQFSSRPWIALGSNGATDSDQGYQNTWEETRAQSGAKGILNNFSGGIYGASFGSGTPQQRAQQFLAQIEPVLPGLTAAWNGKASIDFWPGSPFQRGSYSYWKVGQYTQFSGIEGAAEGNVHFAGEHTSTDYQGYMEGAVGSGETAADEVIDAV